MGSLNIRIGNQWLDHYGSWGNPHVTWRWPLGSWELTWDMSQTTRTSLQTAMLNPDRIPVEAFIDGLKVWAGHLPITDPTAGENSATYTAIGVAREAEEAAAVGTEANDFKTSAVPREAAKNAIDRGILTWVDITALSNTSYIVPDDTPDDTTDDTQPINYLGALLDAWATSESKRWAVTPDRVVIVAADPTVPEYRIQPNTPAIGITVEAVVGRMFARYAVRADDPDTSDVDETVVDTVTVGTGWPEKIVDYVNQGQLTVAQVKDRLTGIQSKYSREVVGWKNGFTVVPEQVTNMGGIHAHLGLLGAKVGRGLMVQILGQRDPRSPGVTSTNAVVGEATWNVDENTLALSPVGSLDDTFETALSDTGATLLS